ncbi:hypothetical protein HPP92_025618 [Vanilla planifolia]|uniref:RRM domain-containing protein n=1 Tax=Vanilla planifolia TaxID=51239 RepID=A0A835U963_VANPL|nr:hypothetical protein HPP92_025618 [Vanilla planifolia]
MVDSPRRRYSRSPMPYKEDSRSRSRGRSQSRSRSPQPRSRSRSRSATGRADARNPGNTLYVTGLSSRVTERDLEEHFSKEGKVAECRLIVEPRTRISRGFAFLTMETNEAADRCVKYLNQSVLEGRYITVEKSRRKRGRTPTPGQYLGLKNSHASPATDTIVIEQGIMEVTEEKITTTVIAGLRGVLPTAVAGITLPGDPHTAAGRGERGPGLCHTPLMPAQREAAMAAAQICTLVEAAKTAGEIISRVLLDRMLET